MKKKILSRRILTKSKMGNTTLTQSTDGEGLYFTATILGYRNWEFGFIEYNGFVNDFHKEVLKRIRVIEDRIKNGDDSVFNESFLI